MFASRRINFYIDTFLLSIFIIISFHFIIYDKLFFLNKIRSIFHYLTIFSLLLCLLIIGLNFFLKININFQKNLIFFIFLNTFFSFYHLIDIAYPSIFNTKYEILLRIFILLIIFFIAFLLSIKNEFSKKLYINHKFRIIKLLIVFFLIINSFIFLSDFIINKSNLKNHKKVVLIYIDGLPKSALGNYNKKIKSQIINNELKNDFSVIQYNNFITSFTGTCGYFSGFFNFNNKKALNTSLGEYDDFLVKKDHKKIKYSKTLFTTLEEKNLSYRQLIGHGCSSELGNLKKTQSINFNSMLIFNSGISKIFNSIGLRSNEIMNSSWYANNDPTLSYHSNTPYAFHGLTKKLFSKFSNKKIYDFTNRSMGMLNNSDENLILLHFANSYWKGGDEYYGKREFNRLIDEINDFFLKIKENTKFNDTLFIITSDHGYVFNDNYFTSQSDASIYIPFLIIKKNKDNPSKKTLDIMCDNIDLSESILNYFESNKNFNLKCNQDFYTSISQINKKEKNWSISLFDDSKKTFNLYDYYFRNNLFNLKNKNFLENKKDLFNNTLQKYSLKIID